MSIVYLKVSAWPAWLSAWTLCVWMKAKMEDLPWGLECQRPCIQTPGHKPHPKVSQSLSLAAERQLCRRVMGSHARVLVCIGPGRVSPWTYTLVPD